MWSHYRVEQTCFRGLSEKHLYKKAHAAAESTEMGVALAIQPQQNSS